jgi:hypothetical protein
MKILNEKIFAVIAGQGFPDLLPGFRAGNRENWL